MSAKLLIDGMLSGTGVRDAVDGGYVELEAIGLSDSLMRDLTIWLQKYEDAHYAGFPAAMVVDLDNEGLALAARAGREAPDHDFGYFSNGRMKLLTQSGEP